MSLNNEEIKKIAFLARLELNDIEISKYQEQLSSILKYIDILKKADSSDLDILGLESDNFNRFRKDEVINCSEDEVKMAINQAGEKENDQIKVNRVL